MEGNNHEIQFKDVLIKLIDYRNYIYHKKRSIILVSLLFFIIGFIYSLTCVSEYNAELTFVVEDDGGSSSTTFSSIANQFGYNFADSKPGTFSQNNILELLKSRGVIVGALMQTAIVDDLQDLLVEHFIRINDLLDERKLSDEFLAFSFAHEISYVHDSVLGVIWSTIVEENLTIERKSEKANIISLSYVSLNQKFAKEFVEKLINEMSKMYISHQTAQSNNTLEFLQERADSIFSELKIAEKEFAKVKDINQRIIKARGRLKEMQLKRKVEVLNTMYIEVIKNLELSKMKLLSKTPIINIIDKPVLPLEEDKKSNIFTGFLFGFFGGFLSLIYFLFRKLFKDALATY
jgi:uncharacterized protein involved in exopolysaccharide biosynthesis